MWHPETVLTVYELNPYQAPAKDAATAYKPEYSSPAEEFNAKLEAFTPRVFVTFVLIGLNVLVYLAMIVNNVDITEPTANALLKWGADFGPLTLTGGQWWRLFSAMFLHIGIIHIAFNMFVLFQAGPFVERLLGNATFLIVYLVSGLGGGLVSLAWNPYIVSAGASGAIFGVYGALLGFLLLAKNDAIPAETVGALTKGALVFIGYNAVYGVLNRGTDLAAHVGGLLAGFACGAVLSTPLTDEHRRARIMRAGSVALAGAALTVAAYFALPRPVDLRAQIKTFAAVETRTTALFNSDLRRARFEKLGDAKLADMVEKGVIPDWIKERDALARFTRLPEKQKQLVSTLVQYMDVRGQGFSMLVQGLRKHDSMAVQNAFQKQREAAIFLNQSMSKLKPVL